MDLISGEDHFLLLDEMEKQDGVLSPRAVIKYFPAVRTFINALPKDLFPMVAVPSCSRRSAPPPALRGRLQNRIELRFLSDVDEALRPARFYVSKARRTARASRSGAAGSVDIVTNGRI